MKEKKILLEDINLTDQELGKGFKSQVYLGKSKLDSKLYAIEMNRLNETDNELLRREILNQRSLKHPNILKLISSALKEYAPNGNLLQYQINNEINDLQYCKIFRQIAEALSYIHQRQIIHRDIKPENILLTENLDAKLADFGFSAKFGDDQLRYTICGTKDFIPPEILDQENQDEKVDVWCLGMLMYESLNECLPFTEEQLLSYIDNNFIPEFQFKNNINIFFKNLIKKCLKLNALERPNGEELINLLKEIEKKLIKIDKQKTNQYNQNLNKKATQKNNLNANNKKNKKVDQINKILTPLEFLQKIQKKKKNLYLTQQLSKKKQIENKSVQQVKNFKKDKKKKRKNEIQDFKSKYLMLKKAKSIKD